VPWRQFLFGQELVDKWRGLAESGGVGKGPSFRARLPKRTVHHKKNGTMTFLIGKDEQPSNEETKMNLATDGTDFTEQTETAPNIAEKNRMVSCEAGPSGLAPHAKAGGRVRTVTDGNGR
jgi:hypothetical protein